MRKAPSRRITSLFILDDVPHKRGVLVRAFGAILYEMLSSERAVKGDDVAETLAAVIRGEVDSSRLPSSTPAALLQLVSRCLDRNVTRRLRDIGEARIVLEDLSTASTAAGVSTERGPGRRWRRRVLIGTGVVVAVLGAAAAASVWWPRSPATAPNVTRFVLSMHADQTLLLDPQSRDLTITPDGKRVVYKGGARADRSQLFVHALDQLTPQALTSQRLPKGPFASSRSPVRTSISPRARRGSSRAAPTCGCRAWSAIAPRGRRSF